ncbi:unnamed protein product, partial [Discosporangium mesarthrocarpum]
QFTFGFSCLPTPAQMRASLADQLNVEDLRKKFRKYAAGMGAPRTFDGKKREACMDRENTVGYFARQALTMLIVDRFIVDRAEHQINISEECRERILCSEVTRFDIFDAAIAEVLHMMETNFKAGFEQTHEFKQLNED